MVLIGVLRYFVSKLMRSAQTPERERERQVIIKARNLRTGANFIPPKSFRARRVYFSNEARKFTDAEKLLKSVSVDEDSRYPFSDVAFIIQDLFEDDDDDSEDSKVFVKLFNLMMKVYSDNGMYSEASETFDFMKDNKIQIDERTCTIHLIALKWSDQVGAALKFFFY